MFKQGIRVVFIENFFSFCRKKDSDSKYLKSRFSFWSLNSSDWSHRRRCTTFLWIPSHVPPITTVLTFSDCVLSPSVYSQVGPRNNSLTSHNYLRPVTLSHSPTVWTSPSLTRRSLAHALPYIWRKSWHGLNTFLFLSYSSSRCSVSLLPFFPSPCFSLSPPWRCARKRKPVSVCLSDSPTRGRSSVNESLCFQTRCFCELW